MPSSSAAAPSGEEDYQHPMDVEEVGDASYICVSLYVLRGSGRPCRPDGTTPVTICKHLGDKVAIRSEKVAVPRNKGRCNEQVFLVIVTLARSKY